MALIEIYHVVADNYAVDTNTLAIKEGMFTLRHDALLKLKEGVTTLEEVLRETAS